MSKLELRSKLLIICTLWLSYSIAATISAIATEIIGKFLRIQRTSIAVFEMYCLTMVLNFFLWWALGLIVIVVTGDR